MKAVALISGGIDSPVAAYLMLKQSVDVVPVYFDNCPFADIRIEFIEKKAYIFCQKINGPGGLPLGSEGKVLCIIENKADILAALLMMKRRCEIILLNNKNMNIDLIKKFSYGYELKIIKNIEEIDEEIKVVVVGQTIKDYKEIEINKMVLRPLIAYDEDEIEKLYEYYEIF